MDYRMQRRGNKLSQEYETYDRKISSMKFIRWNEKKNLVEDAERIRCNNKNKKYYYRET